MQVYVVAVHPTEGVSVRRLGSDPMENLAIPVQAPHVQAPPVLPIQEQPVEQAQIVMEQPVEQAQLVIPQSPPESPVVSSDEPAAPARRYTFHKRKPAQGKSHKKVEAGDKLIEEMKKVIAENFKESRGQKVLFNEIFDVFAESRDEVTESEQRLFTRYCKRVFLAKWTGSKCIQIGSKRAFLHVSMKKN